MSLSSLTLIKSLYAGKLLADRDSQNLSGVDQFTCSYAEKVGGFQIYFLVVAKRGSAE